MRQDPYAPARHTYKASHRYDYWAVDDMSDTNGSHDTPSGHYPFPIIGPSQKKAEEIAKALNQAFDAGYKRAQYEAKISSLCEGYANYPTAMVALWIHHNESVLNKVIKKAGNRFGARYHPCEEGLAAFCNWLREYVEGKQAPDYPSPFAEFINYGLSSVDWYELAQEIYNEAKGNLK